jgi:hypothetical protein
MSKKIEIKIAATGGEQAAAEVRKVDSAVETTTDGVEDLKKELGPIAKAFDDVGRKGGQAADDLKKIKDIQVGEAVGKATEKISEFAGKIVELGPELESAFGAEVAGKIRNVATTIQEVADAGTAIAAGLAAGGPVGGALAGLAVGLGETGKAWVGMRVAQEGATEAADRAAEMQAKLNTMLEDGVESQEGFTAAVLASEIAAEFERQSEALKDLLAELDSVRKVTAAEDKVTAAKRDNEDAAAIRAGANPEDVKAKRVQDDAALAKSRIDWELNNDKKLLLEKQKLAEEASRGLEKLKADPGASPEQIQEAEAILEKAKKIAADAERKFAEKTALAPLKKEEIDTKAAGRLADLNATKDARIRREKDDADRKAATETQREQGSDAGRPLDAGEVGLKIEKLVPDGVSASFRAAVEKASAALQDGGTAAELEEMARLLAQLGGSTNSAVAGLKSEIAAARQQIATLTAQLKNR